MYREIHTHRGHQFPDGFKTRFCSRFQHLIKAFTINSGIFGDFIDTFSFCDLGQRMNKTLCVIGFHTFSQISRYSFWGIEKTRSLVTSRTGSAEAKDRHILRIEFVAHVIDLSGHQESLWLS
ncbi:hypothetical protein TK06_02040 [Pseudomonas fluorescens]|uniref:Uncharacterized protein n=1 Tax=Pseudomonas fluorescens TaxID=294 RepID=A0A159ZV89_PSEFL|nr:hypothetical protein TK06_02040 [Pseudomonas fluorescens]